MIHAMICGFVPTSGAGMSPSGLIRMPISVALRVREKLADAPLQRQLVGRNVELPQRHLPGVFLGGNHCCLGCHRLPSLRKSRLRGEFAHCSGGPFPLHPSPRPTGEGKGGGLRPISPGPTPAPARYRGGRIPPASLSTRAASAEWRGRWLPSPSLPTPG